ncbi:hypothetical protein GCM10010319_31680 [Streptomyces blastmyceticus]|uniref:Uncharacterized protein n=1 Tax=Streptomyces blastmyceticus TaxID=68180 RepID=A0ABP3GTE1_9ACTN
MRVQTRVLDPEAPGERGERELVEPDLVRQFRGRFRQPGSGESYAHHAVTSKIPRVCRQKPNTPRQ